MQNSFTAVFGQEGDWWAAYVEEMPGANSQGRTLEEARMNLKEAVSLLLESRRDLARKALRGEEIVEELLVAA